MLIPLLMTVFVASLLGSIHCVGMCGPFALLASANGESRRNNLAPTVAYSLGRLLSYSLVGVIFGLLGMALNAGTSFSDWQQTATFLAGALMIVVGLIALARCLGIKAPMPGAFKPLQKLLKAGFQRSKLMKPVPRALAIGMLTSLMPCGWLYTFAITSAGTGSPWQGGLLMATFWLGTVPILTATMLGFQHLGRPIQKHLPVAMACLVILVGVFTLAYRAPVQLGQNVGGEENPQNLIQQVREIDHSKLPCCCKNESSAAEDESSQ